jgi:Ubiquitin family
MFQPYVICVVGGFGALVCLDLVALVLAREAVAVPAVPADGCMRIFVKSPGWKVCLSLKVDPSYSIFVVKALVFHAKDIPITEQAITISGQFMSLLDNLTLFDYNIGDQAMLELKVGGDGGAGVKRPRAIMEKGEKVDEFRADINLKLLQITACQHPEVIEAARHVGILMTDMELFPETALLSAMRRMPLPVLQKLHDSLNSGNSDWKVGVLCKQVFAADLAAITKSIGAYRLVEGMIMQAMNMTFFIHYGNDMGHLDFKRYASDILKTTLAVSASASTPAPDAPMPAAADADA